MTEQKDPFLVAIELLLECREHIDGVTGASSRPGSDSAELCDRVDEFVKAQLIAALGEERFAECLRVGVMHGMLREFARRDYVRHVTGGPVASGAGHKAADWGAAQRAAGLVPCTTCNPKGEAGTCGDFECDLCSFADCPTCSGLGWVYPPYGSAGRETPGT